MAKIVLYDTTLRDGAQREGISFSVVDKLKIAEKLDELGIHFIEGGWPGSNPKDIEFFKRAKSLKLRQAKIVAFGSTRRAGLSAGKDPNLLAIVSSGVKFATLVGKSSALQVKQSLETTLKENLKMISDSIGFLKSKGIKVFFDAEHFFDGFKENPDYALKTLEVADDAGAKAIILCDTNGGSLPEEIAKGVKAAIGATKVDIGIHTHNDSELAVANTLVAVSAGAKQIQGTINGYGERCGNANLCSVIPALKLKLGIACVTDAQLGKLTEVSRYVSEMANLVPDGFLPYVGASAFSHKGGLHAAAVAKWDAAYQHIDPSKVGNEKKVLVSELSGRANIIQKAKEMGIKIPSGDEARHLLAQVKTLESQGFQYDHAEASFELLVRRALPGYKAPFELVDFMVIVENRRRQPTHLWRDFVVSPQSNEAVASQNNHEETLAEAAVKVRVKGEILHTVSEGNGPVNALDQALRKALLQYYPSVARVELVDYKVRILEESTGTASQVRVLIESSDGTNSWRTVGSSTNIIEASWLALVDSLEYFLTRGKD